jgi:hypothetical protein
MFVVSVNIIIMTTESEETLLGIILTSFEILRKRRKTRRAIWTKKWLLKRPYLGIDNTLLRELRCESAEDYRRYLRIDPQTFDMLHELIRNTTERKDTNLRQSISTEDRLSLTLRYLATGKLNGCKLCCSYCSENVLYCIKFYKMRTKPFRTV